MSVVPVVVLPVVVVVVVVVIVVVVMAVVILKLKMFISLNTTLERHMWGGGDRFSHILNSINKLS
jgi:hypothetical protein